MVWACHIRFRPTLCMLYELPATVGGPPPSLSTLALHKLLHSGPRTRVLMHSPPPTPPSCSLRAHTGPPGKKRKEGEEATQAMKGAAGIQAFKEKAQGRPRAMAEGAHRVRPDELLQLKHDARADRDWRVTPPVGGWRGHMGVWVCGGCAARRVGLVTPRLPGVGQLYPPCAGMGSTDTRVGLAKSIAVFI